MKRRTLRRAAAPFVLVVTAGCPKGPETISPAPTNTAAPPEPTTAPTTAPTTTATPDATGLVYDGYGSCYRDVAGEKKYAECPESLLPLPPTDRLVYKHGGQCKRVPDGSPVQCPAGGPTAILPDPTSIKNAMGSIYLQYGSLECFQGHSMDCPPKVMCNPPPPEEMPCPPSLMPKLAPGVKPTKIAQQRCWFGAVEVACPKP